MARCVASSAAVARPREKKRATGLSILEGGGPVAGPIAPGPLSLARADSPRRPCNPGPTRTRASPCSFPPLPARAWGSSRGVGKNASGRPRLGFRRRRPGRKIFSIYKKPEF